MLKKIVLAASAAAVVLGAGTAALATSGSLSAANSPQAAASPTASAKPGNAGPGNAALGKGHRPALRALGRALHAQWVTPDRDHQGAFVTHDAIRGEVTAVSATSITVKALDGVSQTYAVTDATKVRLRKNAPSQGGQGNGGQGRGNGGPGVAGKISDVHTGDKVAVIGTGATSLTAGHILDGAA